MDNNQNTMQEQKKHILPHHISRKPMRFIAAICAVAALASGAAYAAEVDTTVSNETATETTAAETTATTFTDIVVTSYVGTDSQNTDQVQINTLVNKNDIEFTAIADKVIYLANQNNIPSGWPVDSRIVSTEFNPTANPAISDGRKHEGMDISTQSQIIPIYATAGGKVITANFDSGYGNQVIIDHGNGYTTLYAHCNELLVSAGETVKKGDAIATTGNTGWSTGIHLHYEVMLNGAYQNPRDFL